VFPKIGIPQNGWFTMENPIRMDDLGVPLFLETSILVTKHSISFGKQRFPNPSVTYRVHHFPTICPSESNYWRVWVAVGPWPTCIFLYFLGPAKNLHYVMVEPPI